MQKKVNVTGANKVFFTVLILFALFSFLDGIISRLAGDETSMQYFNVTLVITQYGLILAPVLIYAAVSKFSFREIFRFRKIEVLPALLIIIIALPAIFVAGMLNSVALYFLQFIGDIPPSPIPSPGNMNELLLGVFLIAVTPAICEEMLHRGLLLSAYEQAGSLRAVVYVSIFFGLFHFDLTNLLGPVFLGLLIGYYVIRTNSILAGMLAHFSNNLISLVFSYLSRGEAEPDKLTLSLQDFGNTVILGFGGALLVYMLIKLFTNLTDKTVRINAPVNSIKEDILAILSHWPIIGALIMYFLFSALYLISIILSKTAGTI